MVAAVDVPPLGDVLGYRFISQAAVLPAPHSAGCVAGEAALFFALFARELSCATRSNFRGALVLSYTQDQRTG